MKYNPIMEDEFYWKYQGLIESWLDFVNDSLGVKSTEEFQMSVAHLVKKAYEMGFKDACDELEALERIDEGKVLN